MNLAQAEELWLACVCQAPTYLDHSQVGSEQLSPWATGIVATIQQARKDGWPMVAAEQLAAAHSDLRTLPARLDIIDGAGAIEMAEKTLLDAWARKEMGLAYRHAANLVGEEGSESASTYLATRTAELSIVSKGIRWESPADVAVAWIEEEEGRLSGKLPPPLRSGLSMIDDSLNGYATARQTTLGAWSGHGKSTLTVQLLTGLARHGTPTALISLEDENKIPVKRIFAMLADDLAAVQRMQRNDAQQYDLQYFLEFAESHLRALPFHVVHAPGWGPAKVCHAIQDAVRRFGARVVAVDYLQCFNTEGKSRAESIASAARMVKSATVQVGAHLILVSQLTRPKDAAKNLVPNLYMLKESGDIENQSDTVMLLHRKGRDSGAKIEEARIIIDKAKDGPTGYHDIGWDSQRHCFTLEQPDPVYNKGKAREMYDSD